MPRQFGAIVEFADSLGSPEASEHWIVCDGSINMLPAATIVNGITGTKDAIMDVSENEEMLRPVSEIGRAHV